MSVASLASTPNMKQDAFSRVSSVSTASSVQTLKGDPRQRITVPMPRNLDDLHGQAARFRIGNMELYHHGKKQIFHDGHVGKLGNEHVVVVTGVVDNRVPFDGLATSADYKAHRIEPRRAGPQREPREAVPFDGLATSADYKAHRIEPRHTGPQREPREAVPFDGTRTSDDYTAHRIEPRRAGTQREPREAVPFDGTRTSDDYTAHHIRPRSAQTARGPASSEPFTGTRTSDDYAPHQIAQRRAGPRPEPTAPTKFEGTSEYLHKYNEHKIQQREMLHLEPALVHRPRGLHGRRPMTARN